MNQYPNEITITNGAYALDGGSLGISGIDENGNNVRIHLNWSTKAQRSGETQLVFNDIIVPKRSPEEIYVINLLERAKCEYMLTETDGSKISSNRIVFGEDIENIMKGIDQGPTPAMKSMVNQLLKNIKSDTYVKGSDIK